VKRRNSTLTGKADGHLTSSANFHHERGRYRAAVSCPGLRPTGDGRSRMTGAKPFDIPKREVWEAFKKVKANQGAAGVDGQSIAE
jgi:hypothetical protein